MKKQLKKAVAIVSALAMVVAGITVTPNYVGAETTGVEAPAEQLKEIGGDAAATWFYDEAKTTGIKEVVNIQKPGFAKESGVYVSVPAGISKVTVNGNDDAALTAIDGAGVVVYLTSLTKEYNTVVITYANGEGTVVIKNVNGTKDTVTTKADVTSADVTSPDASSADVTSPDVSSADVTSADVTSADVTSADVTSADVTSPDASSADVTSADVTSPDASSADVTSADVTSADATSADVTTTPKTTTAKPTTAKPKATTKKVSLKQTKVTKKVTKKLSSKKVKLTFKKVKGAKKYTVQVSTSKKFKKVLYKK
ncbi:MAG: hypothetical protein UCH84_07580, partial [Eubacterium sp.]|nr:hypothetical protein [Eubacterium sp.]